MVGGESLFPAPSTRHRQSGVPAARLGALGSGHGDGLLAFALKTGTLAGGFRTRSDSVETQEIDRVPR